MRLLAAAFAALFLLAGQAVAASRDNVAVIIGNRNYQPGIDVVEYAHRDADAMARFVIDVLGYPKDRVIVLKDATKTQLETMFGNERSHEGDIWWQAREGVSEVVVFYSGHGMPDLREKRSYLLPADADPNRARIHGYPLDTLIENLGKVKEGRRLPSVTVYLDACFSGATPNGALVKNVSAFGTHIDLPKSKPGITLVTAAAADQVAGWDAQAQHGLFTEHLLRTLYGEADGVKGPRVTLADLKRVLDNDMTYAARSKSRRDQKADIQGADSTVLVSWSGGKAPVRPDLGGVRTVAVAPVPQPPVVTPVQPAVASPPATPQPSSSRSPGSVFRDCADCPEMVVVPAGSFMMGSEDGPSDEKPVHPVTISRAFAAGKYEVTQAEWQSVMGNNPSKFVGDQNPVEQVSWNDVQEFIRRLNAKVRSVVMVSTDNSGPYRLLTEAEWEYAARAGTTTPWSCGASEHCLMSVASHFDSYSSRRATNKVGAYEPNAFGLYDMHGNVYEFVEDCAFQYSGTTMPNKTSSDKATSCSRIIRGGSWFEGANALRSSYRVGIHPDKRRDHVGFRLARTL